MDSRIHGGFLAVLAAIVGLATTARAAVDYDPFDYTGTALASQAGGTGWNGGWTVTVSTDNRLSNDGISLAYPVSFESPLVMPTTSGSRVATGGLNANDFRLLSQPVALNADNNVRYVSALLRKNRPNGGGFNNDNILLEFHDSSGNRRWGVGIEGVSDNPWLNANGSTTSTPTVTVGDTYFLVAKIVSSAAGLDTAFLKVFGTGYTSQVPAVEPTTWDATQTETTNAILDRIRIRIDNGNTAALPGEVDEIRVATSWWEVVGQPAVGGDYNGNGAVDAADYVTWRNGGPLANEVDNIPVIDNGDYNAWRARFGNPASGTGLATDTNVPEPAAFVLLVVSALIVAGRRSQRSLSA